MNITFLLPEDNRSGGVRVTAIMAGLLKSRGHNVRIMIVLKQKVRKRIMQAFKGKSENAGWLYLFDGDISVQTDPAKFDARPDEVVIGVGTFTADFLHNISAPVKKLRYNHGFPARFDDMAERVWSYQIPTITVSNTLVPEIEKRSPGSVIGVVPNGIDGKMYYDMGIERKGIGVFYRDHPNKAPEFILEILNTIHREYPDIPIHVASAHGKPNGIDYAQFYHLPSIDEVREIYNKCRIWMLPSDTEGLPGPVLEAMSCGTLVATSDNDGSLEIITHDVDGLVSPRRDLKAFMHNIDAAYNDDALWQRIVDQGKNRAAEFAWDKAADKMEAILAGL